MESETTSDLVTEAAIEMDQMLKSVMPRTWMGHARLEVLPRDDLSEEQKQKVLQVTQQMLQEKNVPAAEMAKVCINKL